MFKAPFSFNGRIRRTEYGISVIIGNILSIILNFFAGDDQTLSPTAALIILVLLVPIIWFGLAQGVKRCHDRGNSGWYMLIPFYGFVLLFGDSDYGPNAYGDNPKGEGNELPDNEAYTGQ